MAVHLHELIDLSKLNGGLTPFGSNNVKYALHNGGLSLNTIIMAHQMLQNAVCFYGGMYKDGDTIKPELSLIKLPFQTTWIEFDSEKGYVIGILATEINKTITMAIWERDLAKDWIFCGFMCGMENKKNFIATGGPFKKDADLLYAYGLMSLQFLNFLNCKNVTRTENKPPERLAKARQKRGKQPFFSYWTLDLDKETKQKAESLGGTHLSPRMHLRRGHPRQYAPEKWCWVQPCVVGKKEDGIVHKDYALKNSAAALRRLRESTTKEKAA